MERHEEKRKDGNEEVQLEEMTKRLADMQRTHAMDIRGVENSRGKVIFSP